MKKTTTKRKREYLTLIPDSNVNFRKIINFYLFECPVDGKSNRGKSFSEQGWYAYYFNTFKSCMMKRASNDFKNAYFPLCKDDLIDKIKKNDYQKYTQEYAIFLKSDLGVIESLFNSIRNALAHGSFDSKVIGKERRYYFVNYDKYMKAQIVLFETTLLNWIEIFNSDPEELKTKNKQKKQ